MVGEREQRFVPLTSEVSVRAKEGEKPTISGMGAMFNSETVIGRYFRERILPGAFKDSISSGDIRVAFNHDPNFILGRTSAGTAKVEETAEGLRYEATPPAARADVVESIQRKDITGSSFTFTVENDEDEEWDYAETKQGKLPLRTIKRATLYETGPVAFPAYENTTVSARAMGKVEDARREREAAEAAAAVAETVTAEGRDSAPPAELPDPELDLLQRELELELDILEAEG